jgi:L-ribulokinase
MGKVERSAYVPDRRRTGGYDRLHAEYSALHDHFGRAASDVMHRLRAMRREVT